MKKIKKVSKVVEIQADDTTKCKRLLRKIYKQVNKTQRSSLPKQATLQEMVKNRLWKLEKWTSVEECKIKATA